MALEIGWPEIDPDRGAIRVRQVIDGLRTLLREQELPLQIVSVQTPVPVIRRVCFVTKQAAHALRIHAPAVLEA